LKDKMDRFNKVKLEACLCIFKKKLPRTHHSNMHCKWTGKKQIANIFGLMLKCSLTMYILVMLSTLILLLKHRRRVDLLEYLLGSIILEKL
jgi:hypothetical protein